MTINCKGNLIDLSTPAVMGILNLTPDSFYDGGKYKNDVEILAQVSKMLEDGATFIDLGAYSSRPGATDIDESLELRRIIPVIEIIIKEFPEILLSVDTFRSGVAKEGILTGASIINDISAGLLDANMLPTVGDLKVPLIMMHMKGNPRTMQGLANYKNIVEEVILYFSERIAIARSLGIIDIIIDPGFGFAKNLKHNYELLKNLNLLKTFNIPILAGLSRKSMIYKVLNTNAQNALNGTTALNMVALQQGASILRVHDVKEGIECVKLYQALVAE